MRGTDLVPPIILIKDVIKNGGNKSGAPDKNTVGQLGDICTDINTGKKYKLKYICRTTTYDGDTVEYEWELIGGFISSDTILRIEVVSELPDVEEDGVLYIVK